MFITNIGFILLAVYLILVGLVALIPNFSLPAVVFAVLAILAGVFILFGK